MTSPRPGAFHRSPADQVRIADECAKVADLRAQGPSLRAIARVMDCDVAQAHRRWHEALTFRTRPSVDAAIEAELARLDHLDERLCEALRSPNLTTRIRAVDSARKNSESRRLLLGINQPTKIEVLDTTQESSEVDRAIKALTAEFEAEHGPRVTVEQLDGDV